MPTKKTARVTAADVAALAGVSQWTVNRAFRPGAPIAEKSRRSVLRVAEKLGYRPSLLARSLATRSTHEVAVLVDEFANPFKLPALEALTAALQSADRVAMLINVSSLIGHLNALIHADQRQVDAIVLFGTDFPAESLHSRKNSSSSPTFVLARESGVADIPSVTCDPAISIREIGDYLLQRGYRRPGFMSGPTPVSAALRRRENFIEFWRRHGVPEVQGLPAGLYEREAGATAMRRYLASTPSARRIDVLMCENDILAFGAMHVARSEFQMSVPKDIAIVGYDGVDWTATPEYDLTTYVQPIAAMASIVVDMIVGRREHKSVLVPGRLIARGSA